MRKILLLSVLLLLGSQAAWTLDWFTVGARVGTPLTGTFDDFRSPVAELAPNRSNFAVGPSAELLLPLGLGFEVDAIYKRTMVELETDAGLTSDHTTSWEFPLMFKYRFPGPNLKPFVGGGYAFRRFSNLTRFVSNLDGTVNGYVAGGGLLIKLGGVRISPEIRFTRWKSIDPDNSGPLRNNQNQADFLVGITF